MKKALIFGAGGQAGYYMTRFLNSKGYEVIALSHANCDVTLPYQIDSILEEVRPDEVYNFASKMFAPDSWKDPIGYFEINFIAVSTVLNKYFQIRPDGKFFQAGSAEIFGHSRGHVPQRESTPIKPRNPYGLAKAAAQDLVRIYREEKNCFTCTGILFNMESPRRSINFFSRRVASGIASIVKGMSTKLILGDLTAVRDWGLVEEYVEAMWLMLQADEPNDYVIGTGEAATCQDFVHEACNIAGIDFDSKVEYKLNWKYPLDAMQADPQLILRKLGWLAKTNWKGVVKTLVEAELNVQSPVA